jgi:hypothetical protein
LPVPSEFPDELVGIERAACHPLQNIRRCSSGSSMRPVQSLKARRTLFKFKRAVDRSLPGFDEKLRLSSWAVYLVSRPLRRTALPPGGPSATLRIRKPALSASEEAKRIDIHGLSRQPGLGANRYEPPTSSIADKTSTARRKQFPPTAFDNHRSSMLPFNIPEGIPKMKRLAPMKTGRRLCSFNLIRCSFKQESCAQPKLVASSPPLATPN